MTGELTILHLYPGELGINGDRGNVTALESRARWRGFAVRVVEQSVGDRPPAAADIVHIGSGPVSAQRAVHRDLLGLAPLLREWADDGVPVLAISGGWQLLGSSLTLTDGSRLEGAGVFPSSATLVAHRIVGEALVETGAGVVAGFENHSSISTLERGAHPFGTVLKGGGNAPDGRGDRTEGVRVGAGIGTHLHGAVLPLNPGLADELLKAALERSHGGVRLDETPETLKADGYAARAREAIAGRLGSRVR